MTLGEQMRSLKAELAADGKRGEGTENLGRKTQSVSSSVMQKIDALWSAWKRIGRRDMKA